MTSTSFSFSGSYDTWTVPAGVISVNAVLIGGAGGSEWYTIDGDPLTLVGSSGGAAGLLDVDFPVYPGETLRIYCGGKGENGTALLPGDGGFNGGAIGGAGVPLPSNSFPGGGGGMTDIRRYISGVWTTILAAGGGGGGGGNGNSSTTANGGAGNGANGSNGLNGLNVTGGGGGHGGTTSAGGTGGTSGVSGGAGQPGTAGTGGAGGAKNGRGGGGGGGGYYGGGGGGEGQLGGGGGGGGGGSGIALVGSVITAGAWSGYVDGSVVLTWTAPGGWGFNLSFGQRGPGL